MSNAAPTLKLEKALQCMRTGSRLVHMHSNARSAPTWFVVPGGAVTDAVATSIRGHPAIVGGEDGFFPGHDQRWRMSNFA